MKTPLLATVCGLFCSAALSAHAASLGVDQTRSRIQVDAKATGHAFTATLTNYEAVVAGDADTLKPTRVDLSWKFAGLDTADAKRNEEMIKWLGGGSPKGSFKFTKAWTDSAGKNNASGTLTINGVAKEVSFPYTVTKDGAWLTLDGKVQINYQDFSLPIIRAMGFMTVDPKLLVRIHLVGKLK